MLEARVSRPSGEMQNFVVPQKPLRYGTVMLIYVPVYQVYPVFC